MHASRARRYRRWHRRQIDHPQLRVLPVWWRVRLPCQFDRVNDLPVSGNCIKEQRLLPRGCCGSHGTFLHQLSNDADARILTGFRRTARSKLPRAGIGGTVCGSSANKAEAIQICDRLHAKSPKPARYPDRTNRPHPVGGLHDMDGCSAVAIPLDRGHMPTGSIHQACIALKHRSPGIVNHSEIALRAPRPFRYRHARWSSQPNDALAVHGGRHDRLRCAGPPLSPIAAKRSASPFIRAKILCNRPSRRTPQDCGCCNRLGPKR